jgi:hypothetical protein
MFGELTYGELLTEIANFATTNFGVLIAAVAILGAALWMVAKAKRAARS